MGWTTTPPSLPSGSSYSSVGTWSRTQNNYATTGTISIARLNTNQVSIRFTMTTAPGEYGAASYSPPSYADFRVKIGSDTTTNSYRWAAQTVYWTGTLASGASATCYAGAHNGSDAVFSHATYATKTAKGPAYVTKYTITYKSNGSGGADQTQSKTYGSSVTLKSASTYSYSGHAFTKWNTKADGSGTDYSAGATYSTNANLTLFAQWAPNQYTVSYNANGGSGTASSQTKTYGVDLSLWYGSTFTREGYHKTGFNTKANGSGTAYALGGTYKANASATMYVQWALDTYTVTYNGNGSTGGSTANQTKTYGAPLTLRQNGFTRQGYVFTGWNTAADGSGTSYAAGATYSANEAKTMYAQWVKANIPAYVNVGGAVYQVDKAYANVDGAVKECDVYVNVGGEIKPIV